MYDFSELELASINYLEVEDTELNCVNLARIIKAKLDGGQNLKLTKNDCKELSIYNGNAIYFPNKYDSIDSFLSIYLDSKYDNLPYKLERFCINFSLQRKLSMADVVSGKWFVNSLPENTNICSYNKDGGVSTYPNYNIIYIPENYNSLDDVVRDVKKMIDMFDLDEAKEFNKLVGYTDICTLKQAVRAVYIAEKHGIEVIITFNSMGSSIIAEVSNNYKHLLIRVPENSTMLSFFHNLRNKGANDV